MDGRRLMSFGVEDVSDVRRRFESVSVGTGAEDFSEFMGRG